MASNVSPLRTKSRFHPNAELSYTLPGHYYYDREIYEREKEEIWFKTWQFVGLERDIMEPGAFLTEDVIDQKIFVVRGKDKRLRAFYNACMHRGHTLLEGTGNVRMITCPFHAWTYDFEGKLKAAGNSENVAGFDVEDFCLSEVQVEAFAHMVFVNLDTDAPSLASLAGDLERDLDETVPNFADMKLGRRDLRDLDCNWKFIPDQNECYHCPHLHVGVGFGSLRDTVWLTTEYDMWAKNVIHANPKEIEGNIVPSVRPEDKYQETKFIWFMWPNLVLVSDRGAPNIKLMRVVPKGPEKSLLYMDNLCLNVPPTEDDLSGMNFYRDVVLPQDTSAMEKQQLGVHARGYTQGRLMVDKERTIKSEHGTHQFDKLVWEALNGPNY